MPTYSIQAPDGKTYEIEGPDGASQAEVAQAVLAKNPDAGQAPAKSGILKTIGTNLLAGDAGTFASALGTAARGVGTLTGSETANDAADYMDRSRDAWRKIAADAGGDTIPGQVSHMVGSILPAMAVPGGVVAQQGANAALFAVPAFRETYEERIKAGDSEALAYAQATKAAVMAQLMPGIAGRGGKALSKALGTGEGALKDLALAGVEGAGFSAADTALTKGIDTVAGKETTAPWIDPTGMGVSAAGFGILRGINRGIQAPAREAAEKAKADATLQKKQEETKAAELNAALPYTELNPPEVTKPGRPTNLMPQQDLFGAAETPNALGAPEAVTPLQRQRELTQQIRLLGDTLEEHRAKVAESESPEDSLVAAAQFSKIQQALTDAQKEHASIVIEATPDEKLAKAYSAWNKAKELGDVDAIAKQAERIVELKGAGATPPTEPMTQTNIPLKKFTGASETATEFGQRVVGPEMAAGREQAAAQRQKLQDEQDALRRIATNPEDNVIPQIRREKQVGAEIAQMEAARINPLKTEQMVIPGTAPELASKVVRGAGTPAEKTEADFRAEFEAAKATRNRPAMLAAVEGIRDARDRATNAMPEGAATQEIAAAIQPDPVKERGQSLVQLLQAKPEDVEASRGRLLERLASDIEATTGKQIPQSQRYALAAEANPVLDTLMKSAKQMTDARKAQAALDDIRNRLAKQRPETTTEVSFAKEKPEEVTPAPAVDTKTVDMFPEEKAVAEQHAADQQKYEEVFDPPKVETQADREARDAQTRIQEQKTAENLGALEGVSVSHEAYRTALDRLEQAPARIEELLVKANDETQPKTTRDKAKRQVKALNQQVILASGMLAHDGEKMVAAKAKVQTQLDVVREKIDAKRAAAEEEGIKKSTLDSRRRELAKLVREERSLNRLNFGLENRAKVTPIAGPEAKRVAAEDRAAKQFLEQHLALETEGTTGKLPARKIGPVVKKAVQAGNVRTGTLETTEQRQLPARNPIEQSGTKRAVTSKQAMRQGEKDAETLARKAAQEELAAANKKPAAKTRAERAIEESEFADESAYDEGGFKDFNPDPAWDAYSKPSAERGNTDLSPKAAEAAKDGRTMDVIKDIKENGSTPEIRAIAALLEPNILRTKMAVEPGVMHAGKEVEGVYKPAENKALMHVEGLTEEGTLHELAHSATDRVLLADKEDLTPKQLAARNELEGMWGIVKGHPALKDEHAAHSVREFAAEVLTNEALRAKMDSIGKPRTLWQRFMSIVKRMWGTASPVLDSAKAQKAIERILMPSRRIEKVADAPSVFRKEEPAGAAESFGKEITEQRSEWAKLNASRSHLPLAVEQKMVDMRAALRRTFALGDKKLSTEAHGALLSADAPMNNAQEVLSAGAFGLSKDSKGHTMLTAGHSASGKEVLDAINKIPGKDANAKLAVFQAGITALRANDVGWEKLDFSNPEQMKAKGQAALDEINADPKLKEAFDNARAVYRDLNHGLVKGLIATHAISEELGKNMLADQNFIPFYRTTGDHIELLTNGHPVPVGDIRRQPFLSALMGGETKLLPFHDALFKNVTLLTDMAVRNTANRMIAYHLQELGKDSGVMKIHRGDGGAGQDVLRFRQAPDKNTPQDDGKRHIVIDTKGTAAEHIPTDLLVQSVAGSYATLPGILKVAGWASDVLRAGVTRMPTYLVTQTIKDPLNAAMMGNLKRNPVAAALKTLQLFGGNLSGKSEAAQTLQKHGVLHSQIFNGDHTDMKKIMMQIVGGEQNHMQRFLAVLDHAAMTADAATREQHYSDVRKAGGSELEGVIGAREMQNFNKHGASSSIQMLSRMVPFFNASIQGLNVLAKSATGKMTTTQLLDSKNAFYKRAMGLTAMAVVYAAMMEDDPEWQQMSLRDKMSYIHVPKMLGGGEGMRIPAPFESGMLFYSLPIAFMDALRNDFSVSDWKTVRDVIMNQAPGNGVPIPQFIKGYFDVSRNYNSGTGQPIEPKGMEHLAPQERFNARTTEAAKRLSEQLQSAGVQLSPMQIEYLSNAYVGQLPQAIATMTNQVFASAALADVNKPAGHTSDIPIIGRFFQNTRGGEDVTQMYDRADKAIEAKATFNHMSQAGRTQDAKDYLKEHRVDIALHPLANSFRSSMLKLNKARDAVANQPKVSAEAKQARLDEIDATRNAIAKKFNENTKRIREQLSAAA